jgi:methyl-accepting chemotaxis protein
MSEVVLPAGSRFNRRVFVLVGLVALPGLAIMIPCLFALLELTTEQWHWLLGAIVVYTVVFTPPIVAYQHSLQRPICTWLDRRRDGYLDAEPVQAAFAATMRFPFRSGLVATLNWILPVIVVGLAMELRWERWGLFELAVLQVAGLAAGFVAGSFVVFLGKRLVEPIRDALVAALPDPEVRRVLANRVPLRAKLLVCVSGVTVVPVVFAVLLAQVQSTRALRGFAIGLQQPLLDAASSGSADGDPSATARAARSAEPTARVELGVVRLDAEPTRGLAAKLDPDLRDHVRRALARGQRSGDSAALPGEHVFSWRALPDGSVLFALSPDSALSLEHSKLWWIFALLLVVSTLLAASLAWLLSEDVSRATETLRLEAQRWSSGDLRRGRVYESEDELGELSRAFEAMGEGLRATVRRVSEAADRVEATAGEMAGVSAAVSSVTADQVRGIQQTTTSMEAIDGQVRGIAEGAQALNVSVEESSSSILELGAAGEELNETASVLSGKVNEVSSSIEQMVRSVRQVLENTEALSEAAVETSASMEQMATSMRQVDESAEETARLSREVVVSAESGQAKMLQTIEGMEAIREATETAERVIRNLGSRTREIGAIVDVIDDVADETNLLALNAAIIAAQAGEQGRAFSVVADEIKELADRVLASTKEIGGLIRAVQEEGSNAIGAIERGAASVALGVDLSAEAGVGLEAITRASRESGTRIAGIVAAVREQAKAAGHVVELMERVREGVEQIRGAAVEQDRGNEVVHSSSVAMREVAQQVRGTTEEQARGSGRIRESVEGVREAVERINRALQEQSAACRSAVEFLESVHARTQSNEDSSKRLDAVAKSLLHQAEALRQDVRRFQV